MEYKKKLTNRERSMLKKVLPSYKKLYLYFGIKNNSKNLILNF